MEDENFEKLKTPKTISSSSSSFSTHYAPWLDLPDPLTEFILERLPLRDYLRIAAVCPKWRSIQRRHRLRHSPGPPPMAHSLPWILPFIRYDKGPIEFFSITEFVLHRFPLPAALHWDYEVVASSHGWLFMCKNGLHRDSDMLVSLFNPVSGDLIHLPPIPAPSALPHLGLLSARPADSDCVAFLLDNVHRNIYVCRVCGGGWTKIYFSGSTASLCHYFGGTGAVHCGGKFYCLNTWFMVVNPLSPAPSVEILEMDCSQLPKKVHSSYLVECNVEVLLVVALYRPKRQTVVDKFEVFKADISNKKWVRVHGLGDRLLFVGVSGSFSLCVADVGCRNDFICYTDQYYGYDHSGLPSPAWMLFDLEFGEWSEGWSLPAELAERGHPYFGRWFVPSLDYDNAPEAGGVS